VPNLCGYRSWQRPRFPATIPYNEPYSWRGCLTRVKASHECLRLQPRLGASFAPCLVVNGVRDALIPVKNSYMLAEHLLNATLLVYTYLKFADTLLSRCYDTGINA